MGITTQGTKIPEENGQTGQEQRSNRVTTTQYATALRYPGETEWKILNGSQSAERAWALNKYERNKTYFGDREVAFVRLVTTVSTYAERTHKPD